MRSLSGSVASSTKGGGRNDFPTARVNGRWCGWRWEAGKSRQKRASRPEVYAKRPLVNQQPHKERAKVFQTASPGEAIPIDAALVQLRVRVELRVELRVRHSSALTNTYTLY